MTGSIAALSEENLSRDSRQRVYPAFSKLARAWKTVSR